MRELKVTDREEGLRLDKLLLKFMDGASTGFIYKMLRKKNITLNKHKSDGSDILSEGDTVESFFSDETFEKFTAGVQIPETKAADRNTLNRNRTSLYPTVIYEDSDILIADKPAGMLSQKAENTD